MHAQKKLDEYNGESIYGITREDLDGYDMQDLNEAKDLLYSKLAQVEHSLFLENIVVTSF
jgi:hypothetical protein